MKQLIEIQKTKKYDDIFIQKLIDFEIIFNQILSVCGNRWENGCGSYLFEGREYQYSVDMLDKQYLIYDKVKDRKNVLEIGTYMGHSLLLMLLSNPTLNITCIDIENRYSGPSVKLLQEKFPNSSINFIHNDSLAALANMTNRFDFFHIDGRHENFYIEKEFDVCKTLCSEKTMHVIFDDIDSCRNLENKIISEYEVLQHITPQCKYPNSFFEIKI
jgi:hypothetical protein